MSRISVPPRLVAGQKINYWTVIEWRGGSQRQYLCKCICGRLATVGENQLRFDKSKSCGCRNGEDLSHQRFGRLIAIEPVIRGDGVHVWRCLCDCGKESLVRAGSLKSGATSSCGCLGLERKREVYQKWRKEPGVSTLSVSFASYKHCAKKRELDFFLTKEDFTTLVLQTCHYCGSAPNNFKKLYKKGLSPEGELRSHLFVNGIDRIDSTKGYVLGNVVPCCRTCNVAKHDLPFDKFATWVSMLISHQAETQSIAKLAEQIAETALL